MGTPLDVFAAETLLAGGGSLGAATAEERMNGNGSSSPIDHLYLKNVLLKFVVAATQGHVEQVTIQIIPKNLLSKMLCSCYACID